MPVTLKFTMGTEMFRVRRESLETFRDVQMAVEEVRNSLSAPPTVKRITYKDEDGDDCTLNDASFADFLGVQVAGKPARFDVVVAGVDSPRRVPVTETSSSPLDTAAESLKKLLTKLGASVTIETEKQAQEPSASGRGRRHWMRQASAEAEKAGKDGAGEEDGSQRPRCPKGFGRGMCGGGPRAIWGILKTALSRRVITADVLAALLVQFAPLGIQRLHGERWQQKLEKVAERNWDGVRIAIVSWKDTVLMGEQFAQVRESLDALLQTESASGLGSIAYEFLKIFAELAFSEQAIVARSLGEAVVATLSELSNEGEEQAGRCPAFGAEGCSLEELWAHPRHTCDGCDAAPIVGPRFHSEARADYDLCATCYLNQEQKTEEWTCVVHPLVELAKGMGRCFRRMAKGWGKGAAGWHAAEHMAQAAEAAQTAHAEHAAHECAGQHAWAHGPTTYFESFDTMAHDEREDAHAFVRAAFGAPLPFDVAAHPWMSQDLGAKGCHGKGMAKGACKGAWKGCQKGAWKGGAKGAAKAACKGAWKGFGKGCFVAQADETSRTFAPEARASTQMRAAREPAFVTPADPVVAAPAEPVIAQVAEPLIVAAAEVETAVGESTMQIGHSDEERSTDGWEKPDA